MLPQGLGAGWGMVGTERGRQIQENEEPEALGPDTCRSERRSLSGPGWVPAAGGEAGVCQSR